MAASAMQSAGSGRVNTVMKIAEVISEMAQPRLVKVWHVTQKRYLPSILQNGLVPQRGTSSRRAREKTNAIYVFPDWTSLEDALTNWLGDETTQRQSVLELTVPENWLVQDQIRWEASINQPVPPSAIKVLIPDIDEWNAEPPADAFPKNEN